MRGAKALVCWLLASCAWLAHGATDPGDVAALKALFADFKSNPTLTTWVENGGDPCGDQWFGITCEGTFVTAVRLHNCGLSGKVHGSVLVQLQHVTVLDLGNNLFDNDIPNQFPPSLLVLDLSNNKFQGNFPDELMSIPSLTSILLNNNELDGKLSAPVFTTLINVVTLDLSNNKFSGPIPATIGANMLSLHFLYLPNNKFSGQLPTSLSNLVALQVFDVSNNELTGYLPPNFHPATFSYQGNNIQGQAPPPPPYTAPPPPPPSQTPPLPKSATPTTPPDESESTTSSSAMTAKLAAPVAVALVALAAATILLWWYFLRKRLDHSGIEPLDVEANHNHSGRFCIWCLPLFSKDDDEKPAKAKVFEEKGVDTPKVKAQPPVKTLSVVEKSAVKEVRRDNIVARQFTAAELQAATGGFAPESTVGEGVYRAELAGGRIVAVKQLQVREEGAFLGLVAAAARLRHAHVVPLVGYCAEPAQQLLVYEYMTRGTLHALLHGGDAGGVSWNARVKIALGAARALEYLHELCSPPVVHRSFTSANVLLDAELTPRVADCGLEVLAPPGCGAPEGTCTAKSDVFSFGVVMLELLTGRAPVDRCYSLSQSSCSVL